MVKMVLGSSDTQGQTMASVGEARITSYNEAISALSAFNSAGDLQGAAYDSGKQYGMNVITPLLKGAIMYTELLSEAVPKLPSKYRSEVGSEDLDSAVLESEIRSLEASLHSIRGMYNAMVGDESTSASTLSSLSNRMDDLLKQRNEKMDKLRKLNMFAGSSNEVFSVGEEGSLIDGLAQNIQTGLSQIQTEFASFGGTFSSHSNDMEWAKNIEGEWDKKAKIDEDYQKVLEKIKDGKELSEDDVKKIEEYKRRYTNRELPETVQVALDKHKQAIEDKKLKAAAKEVSEKEGISYEDALKIVESTVTEEGVSSYLDKIKVNYPKLAEYIQYFTKTDKMGNIHISMNSNMKGYAKAVSNETTKSFLKSLVKGTELPIPGTNSSVGISAISSVFMGIDFLDNLSKENAGRAFVHTVATTATTAVIMDSAASALTTAYFVTGSETLLSVAAYATTGPIGWTIGAGIVAAGLATWAYNNNFLGIKDIANDFGDSLNEGLKNVGNAIDSGFKSIQKVFGW